MRHKLISFCLIVLLLAALPLTAMAEEFDHSQKGSISVTLASPDAEHPMEGAELTVYYVAKVGINDGGKMNYNYTEAFEECGIQLKDPALAEKLSAYVSANAVPSQKIVTDAQGKATYSNLRLGMYLVKQTGAVEGFAPCAPFLVTVPMETSTGYQYQVDASPKTDVVRLTDITIKKVWNAGSSTGIPASVTVQLLRDEEVVETATLKAQNDWKVTFADMPISDDYSIKEVNVPKGYKATYSHKGYEFTVTNTPALIQAGQLVWPIPVLALLGIIFMTVGFVILRKPGKHDA